MIQTISKTITFDEFVAWYPENSVHKYELHNGVIVEMPLGIWPSIPALQVSSVQNYQSKLTAAPYLISSPATSCSNPSETRRATCQTQLS